METTEMDSDDFWGITDDDPCLQIKTEDITGT